MKLLGLEGQARSGKTTVARATTTGRVALIGFADEIKRIAQALYAFTDEQVWGDAKDTPDARWGGLTPRKVYQSLGEGMRQCHPDVWVRVVERTVTSLLVHGGACQAYMPSRGVVACVFSEPLEGIVIHDVRHDNEAEWIRSLGGEVWRVVRPGLRRTGLALSGEAAAHVSERGVSPHLITAEIVNDEGIGQLQALAERVWRSLPEASGR